MLEPLAGFTDWIRDTWQDIEASPESLRWFRGQTGCCVHDPLVVVGYLMPRKRTVSKPKQDISEARMDK
ncbi:Uncharacterised protein [Klebsiella grimontii]|uniref:Uncharacterized protein n=1 Tax=Klebsiella grimontii TaxID=2058152 RepID=A0A7H4P4L3_9ENTR|nr:Uncharacterised protein [Klebsiella grimontii]